MIVKTIRVATVTSKGGREGTVESSTDRFQISFEAEEESAVTPEHLFAGAYAACYSSALAAAAERAQHDIAGLSVQADVALNEDEDGAYRLAVQLRATLPGVVRSEAKHLMHLAHLSCPYSRALRGQAEVILALD